MPSVHFVYASTSGHTEYVIDTLCKYWAQNAPEITIEKQRAEQTQAADLLRGDYLIFGSGTWNTGGIEGQLNMHMHALLMERASELDLGGKPVTSISLGDERYYFRTRCTEHLLRYFREHNAKLFAPPFVLVNEPYGQEEQIQKWGAKIMRTISPLPAPANDTSV